MKTEQNNSQITQKKRLRVMESIHGAMGCYLYMAFLIAIFVAMVCAGLFVAEKLFPKHVHLLNYSLSSRTFVELKAAHKYKAAVDFFEQKQDLFIYNVDGYHNLIEVTDCYKRIGEYEEAERILKNLYNLKYLSDKQIKEINETDWGLDFHHFSIARELVNLYEVMGDKDNQIRYYEIMKSSMTEKVCKQYDKLMGEIDDGFQTSLTDLIKIYDFKALYITDHNRAISEMATFIDDIQSDDEYNPSFVLRCMNVLTGWLIENRGVMPAYPLICSAVEYANSVEAYIGDKSEFGKLSDYCFYVHDEINSKRFYDSFSYYLQKTTSEDDPVYIENLVRGFKYLESSEDWNALTEKVIECCKGLKELLTKNLPSMSESQREYFVSLLSEPFDYANLLLIKHQTDELANLCFDNSLFIKGLLLRSSTELSNKIMTAGDENLIESYKTLQEYRKELSYRENLDRVGNSIAMLQLRRKIDDIDKELTIASQAYRQDKEQSVVTIKDLQNILEPTETAVEFTQTPDGGLFALSLTKNDKVRYAALGNVDDISQQVIADEHSFYTNEKITELIWKPVENNVDGISTVFYSVSGIFNSISFQALSKGGHSHLVDSYSFNLLSNLSNIKAFKESKTLMAASPNIAIWGDIDYGNSSIQSNNTVSAYRDIVRGEGLKHLAYSKDEISGINFILQSTANTTTFEGMEATEASFRSRSGKGDDILHISTHGFFEEDDAHRLVYNPMYNAGLFFAGADSTWNNTETTYVKELLENDGILRANEIQNLNFSNCSLAVLSACKTGLGKTSSSEGVYGLQRAFKLAGVEQILMSLWNVDDKCTSDFMIEFYRNYLNGHSYAESLHIAQDVIRQTYPSPEYWGAFVLLF